jgi:formate dehydrogenase subunit gamma
VAYFNYTITSGYSCSIRPVQEIETQNPLAADMSKENKTNGRIDEEVNKRLRDKIAVLESQIRSEVEKEIQEETKQQDNQEEIQTEKSEPVEISEIHYERFGINFRIQHIILFVSTIMLIVTGIPLKFPKNTVAQFAVGFFGGAPGARAVHHFFAIGLIFIGIYHLLYTFWSKHGRKDFFELLPNLRDFSDVYNQIKYYLGFRKEKVKYGKFSYVEKFDYWAVYWGLIMMIGTGIVMWLFQGKFEPLIFGEINLSWGTEIITNYVHAIAREMHSDEALLATLVIIGWHFYNVHFNPHKFPMSKVWITGKITEKEMMEEHGLEYEEMMKSKQEEE